MRLVSLSTPFSIPLFFVGPPLSEGTLPAFFYFSLSGEESLTLPPYNSPIHLFQEDKIRIFSLTIPFHGPGFDKFKAMEGWAQTAFAGTDFLSPFLDETTLIIHWLIDEGIIDKNHLAMGGLSRGAFIATHLAAREKNVKILLGFAPLTTLTTIKEFQEKNSPAFLKKMEYFDLSKLNDNILHLKHFRFYIGNHDERVSTDACYFFVRELANLAHQKNLRRLSIELRITPSIGFQGHGTSKETFEEGALWARDLLRVL